VRFLNTEADAQGYTGASVVFSNVGGYKYYTFNQSGTLLA
jgi:hypothetical protein